MINKYKTIGAKNTTTAASGIAVLLLQLGSSTLLAQSGYSVQGSYLPQAYMQRSNTPAASSARPATPNYRSSKPPAGYGAAESYVPEPYPAYQEREPQESTARSMKARSSDFDRAVQADIADLWANDRRQDDRLTTIERKLNQNTGGDTARPYRRGYETNQSDDVYTVQYGDSLSEIAARFGTTKDAIRAKNHLDSDWLEEGQRLTIPNKRISSSYSKPAPVASSKTKTSNSSVHYVKAGESLSSIAKGYGMSLATLLAANHLSNPDKLSVGQRLSIPSNASYRAPVRKTSPQKVTTKPTPQYVTKPITTKSYTPPSIALANASEKGAEKSASTLRGVASYRVEQGDTLDSIATTFNTSSEEIRRINALNRGYKPQHGDELVVPSPAPVAL